MLQRVGTILSARAARLISQLLPPALDLVPFFLGLVLVWAGALKLVAAAVDAAGGAETR